jgi:hypothetical protein
VGYVRVFGQVRGRERERRCKGGEEKSSFPVVALPGKKKNTWCRLKGHYFELFFLMNSV